MAAASAKHTGKKNDVQRILSRLARPNDNPSAMLDPDTAKTGIGESQRESGREFRWIDRARDDGIDMKRSSGDVMQKRQRLSDSGDIQPRSSISPLDGSRGWLRTGYPEEGIDGLEVGPPAQVIGNTGSIYRAGKNAARKGSNQLSRGTAAILSKRIRRSERMQIQARSNRAIPFKAAQQSRCADATIWENDCSKVGRTVSETWDTPISKTGTSIENSVVKKDLELTKHARNPQFAFQSPRLVSLAQTASQEGLSEPVVWKALFGQNSPAESVAREMYAFHQDLADGHSFANYPNRKDAGMPRHISLMTISLQTYKTRGKPLGDSMAGTLHAKSMDLLKPFGHCLTV